MKEQIFDTYAQKIAELFNLKVEDLFIKSKKRDIVDARQLLYYACYERPMRVVYIQEFMKRNGYHIGHTSILHGISVAAERAKADKDYKKVVKSLDK
jgi:chromosomal replication initiation ATPase DnaA